MQEIVELIFTLQSRSLICELLENTFSPFKSSTNKARMAKNGHTTDTANSQHLEKNDFRCVWLAEAARSSMLQKCLQEDACASDCRRMAKPTHTSTEQKKKLHSEPDLLELCDTAIAGPMRSQIHFLLEQCLSFRAVRRKKPQGRLLTFKRSEGSLLLRISNQEAFHSVLAERTRANASAQFLQTRN